MTDEQRQQLKNRMRYTMAHYQRLAATDVSNLSNEEQRRHSDRLCRFGRIVQAIQAEVERKPVPLTPVKSPLPRRIQSTPAPCEGSNP